MAAVRDALARAIAGRGALLLLAGEAGIGKTALADACAAEAERAGATVAWGRCWEAGDAPAYWPWMQVFRALGIADPFAEASRAGGGEARDVRFRVFDQAAERLRARALKDPVVVVLDDLHAADVPSLLFLQLVARNLRAGGRLGVVVTYRAAEARIAGAAGELLAKIAREGHSLALARLTAVDVARWIRAEQPDASETALARVHAISEGNPLFVRELLRVRTALDAASLPDGLRAVLDEHLSRVSPDARALLAVASVLGREWSDEDLAALAQSSADATSTRLAEAREAGLVVRASPGRHAFGHVLLRDRVYAELPPSRRAEVHAAAGARSAAAGDLASAAHHLLEARRDDAPSVALDAAQSALRRLAFEQAERVASRALAVAQADTEIACELEMVVAQSLIRAGEMTRGREAAVRAATTARKLGDSRLLARAGLAYGEEMVPPVVHREMVDLLEGALSGLAEADDMLRAQVMARLASALLPPDTLEVAARSLRLAQDAIALARRVDEETLLFALRFGGAAAGYNVSSSQRLEYARETIELATKLERPVVVIDRGGWYASHLREHGRHAEASAVLDAYLRLVGEFAHVHYRYRRPLVLATHASLDGDFERAERLSREAREIIEENPEMGPRLGWATHRIALAMLRDDAGVLHPDLEAVTQTFGRISAVAWWADSMSAIALAMCGRADEARARLGWVRYEAGSFVSMLMMGHLALLLRDRQMAARVLDPLIALRGQNEFFWSAQGIAAFGPASRVAGDLAAMLGRTDEARRLLEEAVAVGERMASPPLVALARKRLAALGTESPPKAARPPAPRVTISVTREGETWRIRSSTGADVVLKDGKGLHYLAELVREPEREFHVTQLADLLEPAGDAGVVLDAKAKDAYRRRLEDLRDTLEEARRFGDQARAERAEAEIDALVEQLAGAVGLGGRDRKMGSHVERARINVQRRLKDVMRRVEEQDPALARYLSAAIRTGVWCSFSPP
jgi:hypothetical protein